MRHAVHPALTKFARFLAPLLLAAASGSVHAQVSPGPLSESHADLAGTTRCLKCHGSGSESIRRRCLDCHAEIDYQIRRDLGLHGQDPDADCATCHPEHAGREFELIEWKDGSPKRFDHSRTGWQLEGKHAALRCEQCHKPQFQVGAVTKLVKRRNPEDSWLGLERNCLACHEDRHQRTLGTDCLSCHGSDGWKPAPRFDHGKSSFPLTGKHADLACDKCHLVPDKVFMNDAAGNIVPRYKPLTHQECSGCHHDVHSGQLGPLCASCHVTAGFKIVDQGRFDHAKTRYPLRGKHAAVDCARCHDPQRAWGKKPAFQTCNACHRDAHAGRATLAGKAVDCAACHDLRGFTPCTYGVEDHRDSGYPLEGKHLQVPCRNCHVRDPSDNALAKLGTARVLLRPAYAACGECHRDLHAGQLASRPDQGACESCHRVMGWKPSTYSVSLHSATEFELDGRHAEVACAACHGPLRTDLKPLPGRDVLGQAGVALTAVERECSECHHDPHLGRFEPDGPRPMPGGCRACHDSRAFVPSAADLAAHSRFDYPLEGAHRAVPCILCHEELQGTPTVIHLLRVTGQGRDLTLNTEHERCDDCHATPHGNQFAERADRGACEGCHVVEAWNPADRFDHERDAAFSLEGGHRDVACDRCHEVSLDAEGRPSVVYRPVPQRCQDCHGRRRR